MKKIAIFLIFILVFSFSSCGTVKDKVAEKVEKKIEEKVNEEVSKVEKELEKAEEELDKVKESANEEVKEDEKEASDKKDRKGKKDEKEGEEPNFKEKANKSMELALEIFEEVKGDLIYDVSSVFPGDFDGDGEDEVVIVTSYITDYDVSLCSNAYLVDLSEKKVIDEIIVDNYAATGPRIVRFEGGEESFLCFIVENGANLTGLLLFSLNDKGFDLAMMGVPSMPPAYITLIDENQDGIYEGIYEDLINEDVFYYPCRIMDYYAQGEFYIEYVDVDMGDYPETPAEVVRQYVYALHLRDTRFDDVAEVFGLDERLAELVTKEALTTEIYFANDLLVNTAMQIEPKLVFEEKVYDDTSAQVYITIKGDYTDEASARTSENFGFGMTLVKEDGKWKINAGYSLY